MPRPCRVCQDPRRPQIEAVFREGYSVGYVMMRFPGLTRARLERHRPHYWGPPDAPPPVQPPVSRYDRRSTVAARVLRMLRRVLRRG